MSSDIDESFDIPLVSSNNDSPSMATPSNIDRRQNSTDHRRQELIRKEVRIVRTEMKAVKVSKIYIHICLLR